jgi:hypothetical protein
MKRAATRAGPAVAALVLVLGAVDSALALSPAWPGLERHAALFAPVLFECRACKCVAFLCGVHPAPALVSATPQLAILLECFMLLPACAMVRHGDSCGPGWRQNVLPATNCVLLSCQNGGCAEGFLASWAGPFG